MHVSFTNLSLNHARTSVYTFSTLRKKCGITRYVCKACKLCPNQHTTMLYYDIICMKISHGMVNTHSNYMLPHEAKNGPLQGQQGEGVVLSFLGPQGTILITEIPQDFRGEEAQTQRSQSSTEMAQNKGQTSLKRGQTTPKLKTPLTNYLEHSKTRLFYVIC